MDGVSEIMVCPKGLPTVPVTPVYFDEDCSWPKRPPKVEPLGKGVINPVGAQPIDDVSVA